MRHLKVNPLPKRGNKSMRTEVIQQDGCNIVFYVFGRNFSNQLGRLFGVFHFNYILFAPATGSLSCLLIFVRTCGKLAPIANLLSLRHLSPFKNDVCCRRVIYSMFNYNFISWEISVPNKSCHVDELFSC